MLCALLGIAIMRGVTLTERCSPSGPVRLVATGDRWPRGRDPGAVHAGVLSSGHGAIGVVVGAEYPLTRLLLLVGLKAMASAISIGSGSAADCSSRRCFSARYWARRSP